MLDHYGDKALQFVGDGGFGTMLKNKKNVDSGNSHSFSGFLKLAYPYIQIQHCLDHALDLINSKAIKEIPKYIRDLIKQVAASIRSAKQRFEF